MEHRVYAACPDNRPVTQPVFCSHDAKNSYCNTTIHCTV